MLDDPVLAMARQYLAYDPETGIFTWTARAAQCVKIGAVAGRTVPGRQYRQIKLGGVSYYAHRLAWLMHYGEWPAGIIDHINRDGSDNRIENLRVVTATQNTHNRRGRIGHSIHKGVTFHVYHNKWMVAITANGATRHVGYFLSEIEAAKAYDVAAKELHGTFAVLNFPRQEVA